MKKMISFTRGVKNGSVLPQKGGVVIDFHRKENLLVIMITVMKLNVSLMPQQKNDAVSVTEAAVCLFTGLKPCVCS